MPEPLSFAAIALIPAVIVAVVVLLFKIFGPAFLPCIACAITLGAITYHATCRGTCSRLEFAREILRLTGNPSSIKAVEASQTSLSSVRPNYSVLDNFILRIIDVYDMPAWQDSLAEYIRGLS